MEQALQEQSHRRAQMQLLKAKNTRPAATASTKTQTAETPKHELKLLAPKHELKLVSKTPSADEVQARNELIEANIELARRMTRSILKGWNCRIPVDDQVSIANLALCEAATRFDKSRGVEFPTFLYYYVKGHVGVAVTESVKAQQVKGLSSIPREGNSTPDEAFNIKRGLLSLLDARDNLSSFDRIVADNLVFADDIGVGELAAQEKRARETVSRRSGLLRQDLKDRFTKAEAPTKKPKQNLEKAA